MAAATIVDTQPRLFSSEPITDEEAGAMYRAVVRLVQLWGMTDEQAATLLDVSVQTYSRWKAGDPGRVSRDGKARLSNLLGIHKTLRIIFEESARSYRWIGAPNDAFGGRSAAEVMLSGEPTDLIRVRRYLDAKLGGW